MNINPLLLAMVMQQTTKEISAKDRQQLCTST